MRCCKSLVVSLAFDEVEISENESHYLDRIQLKMRIRFVPVTLAPALVRDRWNKKTQCPCLKENCSKCALLFELKAEGKATYPPSRTVVWSDGLILKGSVDSESVVPVPDATVPILELEAGQKIRLRALVRRGCPSTDAKFLKCVKATFSEDKQFVCSKGLDFQFTEGNDKHRSAQYSVCVESVDALPAAEYLNEAFNILRLKMQSIIDALKQTLIISVFDNKR